MLKVLNLSGAGKSNIFTFAGAAVNPHPHPLPLMTLTPTATQRVPGPVRRERGSLSGSGSAPYSPRMGPGTLWVALGMRVRHGLAPGFGDNRRPNSN